MIRSFLFVPADSEKKLEKAASLDADALILDLEDSVAAEARPRAREIAKAFLTARRRPSLWVRINPIDTDDALLDLEAVVPAAPAGIVLPKPRAATDVVTLSERLAELEQEASLPSGATRVLPIVTERPEAVLAVHGYTRETPRLAGLTWGAEDLSAALGAAATRFDDGRWRPPYELARSLCLLAAAAAGVPAIDTVYTDYRDLDGLARYAADARRDGFSGMLAIHPAQVPVINEAFAPTAEEIEEARRVVAAFEAHPGAGTVGLDGRMLDRPHEERARRVLELAGRSSGPETGKQ
ncbi:MAG TPA: CoA ester lyase [Woeseiaceae bacterium]|nr:CoA ester lyase [Woeseiaceae bacterium]